MNQRNLALTLSLGLTFGAGFLAREIMDQDDVPQIACSTKIKVVRIKIQNCIENSQNGKSSVPGNKKKPDSSKNFSNTKCATDLNICKGFINHCFTENLNECTGGLTKGSFEDFIRLANNTALSCNDRLLMTERIMAKKAACDKAEKMSEEANHLISNADQRIIQIDSIDREAKIPELKECYTARYGTPLAVEEADLE